MGRRISSDNIDHFFNHGIFPPASILYVGDEEGDSNDENDDYGVGTGMAERVIKALNILAHKNQGDPILIVLNTYGGYLYRACAIYDAIRLCKANITIIGYGALMSAGSIIFQAGDTRIMAPSTTMMLHYGTLKNEEESPRYEEERLRLKAWMEKIYLERIQYVDPNFSLKNLQEKMKYDWFMGPEEAVVLGLADKVAEDSAGLLPAR